MNSFDMKKFIKPLLILIVLLIVIYGSGRLYFAVTAGFTMGNISSEFAYNPKWDLSPPTPKEAEKIKRVLSQKFTYLGKGCQSYVFGSEDGNYVLKFVKFQRFRPQQWLDYLTFIPLMDRYRLAKIEKKNKKLDMLFASWKIAYENLRPETGLIFVHLNQSNNLQQTLTIFDKMGFEHHLDLDQTVFLLQERATMLCPTISRLVKEGKEDKAQELLDKLLLVILSEYERGLADNDHALMQNTGVIDGQPVHIDVGQFVIKPEMRDPAVYKPELFSKTYKFSKWLERHHPNLANYFNEKLENIIGKEMHSMVPRLKNPHAWSVEVE